MHVWPPANVAASACKLHLTRTDYTTRWEVRGFETGKGREIYRLFSTARLTQPPTQGELGTASLWAERPGCVPSVQWRGYE